MNYNKHALLITPSLDSFISNWRYNNLYPSKKSEIHRVYFDLDINFNDNDIAFLEKLYKIDEYTIDESIIIGPNLLAPKHNKYILMSVMANTRYRTDTILLSASKDENSILTNQNFLDSIKHTIQSSTKSSNIIVDNILKDRELGDWCKLFTVDNPKNKMDLITKTTNCKSYLKPRTIPVFEFSGSTYKETCVVNMLGCLECENCFKWVCALNYAGLFLPFFNNRIIDINLQKVESSQFLADLYPRKMESVTRLYRFLDWINFKNIRYKD